MSPLQSTSSGVVPYLGTYLTVLTMLDTALPDTVEVRTVHTELQNISSYYAFTQGHCSVYYFTLIPSLFSIHKQYFNT